MSPISQGLIGKKKTEIEKCCNTFDLERNLNFDDSVLAFEGFPDKCSKSLAVVILTYNREATNDELKRISDQPAGLVKGLRKKGFVFREYPKVKGQYHYKNESGVECRQIVGYEEPKVFIYGHVQEVLDKSVAACISAIEIYNKPDFKYREETFSILMVNSWELLLKAKILLKNNNKLSSIFVEGKKNRSGNGMTIDIFKAVNTLIASNDIDPRCAANIEALVEIRDNAVHFINKSWGTSLKVQEFGTASLSNYVECVGDWFQLDLSQYYFYLMPLSFISVAETKGEFLGKPNSHTIKFINYLNDMQKQFPYESDNGYNIALRLETKLVKATDNAAMQFRYSNESGAIPPYSFRGGYS